MTTAGPRLTLPAGISDETTRALLAVLERWDDIPVEAVLVWLVDEVAESALPHVAEMLGLARPEFQVAGLTPRALLKNGIELRRRRGTVGALEEVLGRLGYDDIDIDEDTSLLHDGEITRDGVHLYGADSHWAIYIVNVTVPAPLSHAALLRLWDVLDYWRPRTRRPILVLTEGADAPRWFRSLADIEADEEDGGEGGWAPLDDVGTASLLLLPGGYDPDGASVGVGRWFDQSGNDRHFDGNVADVVDGCPVFAGSTWLSAAYDIGVDLASPDNGTIIVISKQAAPLPANLDADGPYYNPATVSGSGATPALYQTDTGAKIAGYNASGPPTYDEAFAASGVAAPDVPHIQVGAWDSAGVYAACDEDAFSAFTPYQGTGASLSAANIGDSTYVGRSYGANFTGTIMAVAMYPTKQSDEKIAQWRAWADAQGLLALPTTPALSTINASGAWEAPFTALPWPGLASGGDSEGRDLVALVEDADPVPGEPINGLAPPHFDGSMRTGSSTLTLADFFTATAGGIVALLIPGPLAADTGTDPEPKIITDSGSYIGLGVTESGARFFIFDDATHFTDYVPVTEGEPALLYVRWGGGEFAIKKAGTEWPEGTPTGPIGLMTGLLRVMSNYATTCLAGDLPALYTFDHEPSDEEFANVRARVNGRFNLTL